MPFVNYEAPGPGERPLGLDPFRRAVARRHAEAVIQAEIRRLAQALAPQGRLAQGDAPEPGKPGLEFA